MMEGLLSTDGLNELQDTWRRFDLHYAGARPWGEFFEQFKPTARDLDTRMATNWLHYKANYAQLTTLVVALGLLWWPTSLFALCVAAIASTASVTACPSRRIVTVGSYSVKLTTKNRALAAAVAACVAALGPSTKRAADLNAVLTAVFAASAVGVGVSATTAVKSGVLAFDASRLAITNAAAARRSIPTILQLLVFAETVPTVNELLDGDAPRIRAALAFGSLAPLVLEA